MEVYSNSLIVSTVWGLDKGYIVVATANEPTILDAAILSRPGLWPGIDLARSFEVFAELGSIPCTLIATLAAL